MKDLVHHLKHLQKKVIASSRKDTYENNSFESKSPLENQAKNSSNQRKRELR
jgi:hypothetical protein